MKIWFLFGSLLAVIFLSISHGLLSLRLNNFQAKKIVSVNNASQVFSKANTRSFQISASDRRTNESDKETIPVDENFKFFHIITWIGFIAYAYYFTTSSTSEASATDTKLLADLIASYTDSSVHINPLLFGWFNIFPFISIIYAGLTASVSKKQQLQTTAAIIGSTAIGYFALGPFLGTRKITLSAVEKKELGFVEKIFESKLLWGVSILFAANLLRIALTQPYSGDAIADFYMVLQSQPFVNVGSVDLTIMSIAAIDPMNEDMQRRSWTGLPAPVFCTLPVFGPLLYLLIRPPIEEDS